MSHIESHTNDNNNVGLTTDISKKTQTIPIDFKVQV